MNNLRKKLTIFTLIGVLIIAVLQNSLVQNILLRTFPIRHELAANTLSPSIKLAWTYSSDHEIVVPPKANEELVIILDRRGYLTAFDNSSGNFIWEYPVGLKIGNLLSNNVFDADNNSVVISQDDGSLLALDVSTGRELWNVSLPSFRTIPDILIMDTVVVVSIFSVISTEGYVAIHNLEDGSLLWHKSLPNRSYEHVFDCSNISEFFELAYKNNETVCISLWEHLEVVAITDEGAKEIVLISHAFPSNDQPNYQASFIFTNPSPNPKVQYYNVVSGKTESLPANCRADRAAEVVTFFEGNLLVANGCNEAFLLDLSNLEGTPDWIFQSEDTFVSPFVTINGRYGFVLTSRAEIVEIDLFNGELVGKLTTIPDQIRQGKLLNRLVSNPPFLYSLIDGYTLFVLREQ